MSKEEPADFTHLDESGAPRMVDISAKEPTARRARAQGSIRMSPDTLAHIRKGPLRKGNVLSVAKIAAISAAKETARIIPLCHTLPLEAVDVDFTFPDEERIEVVASATCTGKTGVEMEALVAVAIALLTIYDMAKALDRAMVIEEIRLIEKTGGRSGTWRAG